MKLYSFSVDWWYDNETAETEEGYIFAYSFTEAAQELEEVFGNEIESISLKELNGDVQHPILYLPKDFKHRTELEEVNFY